MLKITSWYLKKQSWCFFFFPSTTCLEILQERYKVLIIYTSYKEDTMWFLLWVPAMKCMFKIWCKLLGPKIYMQFPGNSLTKTIVCFAHAVTLLFLTAAAHWRDNLQSDTPVPYTSLPDSITDKWGSTFSMTLLKSEVIKGIFQTVTLIYTSVSCYKTPHSDL